MCLNLDHYNTYHDTLNCDSFLLMYNFKLSYSKIYILIGWKYEHLDPSVSFNCSFLFIIMILYNLFYNLIYIKCYIKSNLNMKWKIIKYIGNLIIIYVIRSSSIINYNIVLLDTVCLVLSDLMSFILFCVFYFEGAYHINIHYIFTVVHRQIFYYFIIYHYTFHHYTNIINFNCSRNM